MKNIYLLIFVAICAIQLPSCSKDTTLEGARAATKYINLELTASYFETPETTLDKMASAGIEKYDDSKRVSEIASGFFAEFQIEEGHRSSSGGIKKSINKLAAKEGNNNPTDLSQLKLKKLENGIKFMVLIFDENDNHVGTTLATMGEQTRIPVVYKKDYVFNTSNYYRVVAFTYNTKNESDYDSLNLNPTQTADNPKLVIPSDKEFFYYNGDFLINPKVTDVSYKLPIVFLPQTVKVGVTVDGKGANVKVKKMSGTFGSFSMRSTAEFDLKLNKVLSRSEIAENAFPYTFTATGEGDTLSVARFIYMNDSDGEKVLSNYKVTLNELIVQKNGANNDTTLFSNANVLFEYGNINLKKGKYYNGKINLITGFQTKNIIWAHANLYFDAADSNNPYKIRGAPNEGIGVEYQFTDYWRPFYLDPAGTGTRVGDPCAYAHPSGWRMPTMDEADYMINDHFSGEGITQIYVQLSSTDARLNYMEYKKGDQSLKFYSAGYYMKDDLLANLENTATAIFVTSNRTLTDNYYTLAYTLYPGKITDGFTDAIVIYSDSEVLYNHRFNIRCVRELK